MKTPILFILLVTFFHVGSAWCQTPNAHSIRCIYLEDYIKDGNNPSKRSHDEFYLDIQGNQSAFYSIHERTKRERQDSLLKTGLTYNEVIGKMKGYTSTFQYFEYYKNTPKKGSYTCFDKVVKTYRYEDKMPELKWKITSETKTIAHHKCQKATTEWGGRTWTAWFTTAIPISNGPWLLSGLPGLILEAQDAENIFHFIAIELRKLPEGTSVRPPHLKHIPCTRNEFVKLRDEYNNNPQGGLGKAMGRKLTIMGADGKPLKAKQHQKNYFEK